jgi:hypothetical protein
VVELFAQLIHDSDHLLPLRFGHFCLLIGFILDLNQFLQEEGVVLLYLIAFLGGFLFCDAAAPGGALPALPAVVAMSVLVFLVLGDFVL